MINNKKALVAHLAQSGSVKYLYFWGHTSKSKSVDKSCLSQWFPASFTIDGDTYPTAEHYMMAQKARLFKDSHALSAILSCSNPAEAKKFGRQVKNFDADIWNKHCFDYVVEGNIAKFAQNPALKTFLLNTKKRVLVEASPHDAVWGIGMAITDPDVSNPEKWLGENLLGFALMSARDHLVQQGK